MSGDQHQKSNAARLVRTCSIWRALDVLGDVPTLLILESIWLGDLRFSAIRERTCLSRPLVTERLKSLVGRGVLQRHQYCDKPPRHEYRLTEMGRDLFPVTMMLLRWEKSWSARRASLDMELTHHSCEQAIIPQPLCSHCREVVKPQDIDWREGPGLAMVEPEYTRRRAHRNRQAIAQNLSLFTDSAELLGDRWAGLAMRAIFTGLNRFDEILDDSGMASNILSDRLAWLVEHGFLKARMYQTSPNRFAYTATAKSLDYLPVLLMIQRWGDRYFGAEEGPPVLLTHTLCGAELEVYAGCGSCSEELLLPDVTIHLARSEG
ncbi:winged helix-turn-helix transcriptional regulator [Qipengyuania sp. DSG2-2]|uniref:winged helix-turn-helix transcriptional regulator n=1 Tax=Qipengyuania sp. DGS2-2 TaxID=3349631 RepID=UPI0036D4139F